MAFEKGLRKCANCDVEFMAHYEKNFWCLGCTHVLQAVGVPEVLLDMRKVYKGLGEPGSAIHAKLREVLDKEPGRYLDRLNKLEEQYRATVLKWEAIRRQKAGVSQWDGEGVCPGCNRGTMAEVVVDSSTTNLVGKVEGWLNRYREKEGV